MEKLVSSAYTEYAFDAQGQVVAHHNRTNWLRHLVPLGTRPLARYQDGVTYFLHSNHLGSTTFLTDHSGTVTQKLLYYPWGQTWATAGTAKDVRFASLQQRDAESDLDPTLARMYESRLYRWLSPDPVAGDIFNPQSLNRYAYVVNNPVNFIDPLGLQGHGPRDRPERLEERLGRISERIGRQEVRLAEFSEMGCRLDGAPISCRVANALVRSGLAVPTSPPPGLGPWLPVSRGAQSTCPGCYWNPRTDEIWDPRGGSPFPWSGIGLTTASPFYPGMNATMQWAKQIARGIPKVSPPRSLVEPVGTPMRNVGPADLANKEWEAILRGTARYLSVLQQYLNMMTRGSMTISVPLVIVDPRSVVPYAYGREVVDPRM